MQKTFPCHVSGARCPNPEITFSFLSRLVDGIMYFDLTYCCDAGKRKKDRVVEAPTVTIWHGDVGRFSELVLHFVVKVGIIRPGRI